MDINDSSVVGVGVCVDVLKPDDERSLRCVNDIFRVPSFFTD